MRRVLVIAAVLLAVIPGMATGYDRMTRPVSPIRTWSAADLERFHAEWLQVKFVEGSDVRLEGGDFVDDAGRDLSMINGLVAQGKVVGVRRSFAQDRAILKAWKAQGEARSGVVGPDLSLWFDIRVEGGRREVARLVNELNTHPDVEICHPVPFVEPAVMRSVKRATAARDSGPLRTPDYTDQQEYLYDPPVGLDGPAAWAKPGGKGDGIRFIDVELCWTEDHEDFNHGNLFYEGGAAQDPSYEAHGTAVLGEVIGQHNDYGVSGFAPEVEYGVVAVTVGEWPEVSHYFQEAIDALGEGDVWLIELQMYPPGKDATPMEWLQANYDVIWTGVWSRGVVCIEAGANGSQDLDNASWGGVFDRNIRDSGAIMVGAGTPYDRVAEWFTNYGSRMDVHAWGSEIVTTGYGDLYDGGSLQTRYTATFGGTSGASPMVTGCALCLQGIAQASRGWVIDPIDLRALLHDTGIPHLDITKEIGPRPDLAAAIAAMIDPSAVTLDQTPGAKRGSSSPNPFSVETEIGFTLSSSQNGSVKIFDTSGRTVRTLHRGRMPAGELRLHWDGRDDFGRHLDSGVYFYRLNAGSLHRTGSLELIR